MTLYTEGSLLINLMITAKQLKVFFSVSYSDSFDQYSCWTGTYLYQDNELSKVLIQAYRKMAEYSKEYGIDMEEDVIIQ